MVELGQYKIFSEAESLQKFKMHDEGKLNVCGRTLDYEFRGVGGRARGVSRGAVIEARVLGIHRLYREHAAPAVDGADARAGDRVGRPIVDRPLDADRLITVCYYALEREVITEKGRFVTSGKRCDLRRN